ncbi:flagellar hook-basal body complex protein FliE [Shewanella sp. A32]|uniref:flagellar hook-basal body complex protein FliE n=1 Tax=Shewanella sp. A32 TaxID=3031327 RepID=UPI0023B8D527|nr:flagellar hook-basal body complex protein FliE [Shewanella sp. A32]MDF0535712.1 flagellar hook-basal body complex protein FliE [Shewanella sp. A32]
MEPISTQNLLLNRMNQMELMAENGAIAPANNSGIQQDFMQVVRDVNAQQNLASEMMQAVDTGASQDVVGAMVTSQKANLSFNMLMEVRNKVLSGFDDVMRMTL